MKKAFAILLILALLPICALAGESYAFTSGIYSLTIEKTGESARTLTVSLDDKTIQTIEYESSAPVDEDCARVEDINFDGYPDLALQTSRGAANEAYLYYLCDIYGDGFQPAEGTENLSNVVLYPTLFKIYSFSHISAAESAHELYAWDADLETLSLLRAARVNGDQLTVTDGDGASILEKTCAEGIETEALKAIFADEYALAFPEKGATLITAVSYGILTHDYAQERYMGARGLLARKLNVDVDTLSALPIEEVYKQLEKPMWNVWLRLDSLCDARVLEALYDFKVSSGDAVCADKPVGYSILDDIGSYWFTRCWSPRKEGRRAALYLYCEDLTKLSDVTLSCTLATTGEEISISLRDAAYDSGVPAGGTAFSAKTFTRLTPSGDAQTLKDWCEAECLAFPDLPSDLAALPLSSDDFAVYQIEGEIAKKSGDFGVYDVTFALADAPEGAYIEAYEHCDMCDEIDTFDLHGLDSILDERLSRDFNFYVILRADGRSDAELDDIVRGLSVLASFSGEKWNFIYEQHGTTSMVGPRVLTQVDTAGMTKGE